jgi:hypothetical protein
MIDDSTIRRNVVKGVKPGCKPPAAYVREGVAKISISGSGSIERVVFYVKSLRRAETTRRRPGVITKLTNSHPRAVAYIRQNVDAVQDVVIHHADHVIDDANCAAANPSLPTIKGNVVNPQIGTTSCCTGANNHNRCLGSDAGLLR